MPDTSAPDLEGLGIFIHDRRLGLTRQHLAERFGVLQERISILEHGKYGTPSLPSLARLGAALQTSWAALLQAAGYTDIAVCGSGPQHPIDAKLISAGSETRDSRNDKVETSGLSALLAAEPELKRLKLALAQRQWTDDDEYRNVPTQYRASITRRRG